MDSESIDYKALYEQVQKELEDYKLNTWIRSQVKPFLLIVWERLQAQVLDMSIPEWVACLVILSIGVHFFDYIQFMKRISR